MSLNANIALEACATKNRPNGNKHTDTPADENREILR